MRANLSLTDGIYAVLTNTAVQERIEQSGKNQNAGGNPMDKDIAAALRVLADRVESRI